MQIEKFIEIFKEKSKKFNIELTLEEYGAFYKYMNILTEWNKKINLTSITDPEDIITKHFIDSLTVIRHLNNCKKIIDIGSGAGFPGIPVKIINREKEITLLDSVNKKINFLEDVKEKLELKNLETIHGRAEDYGQNTKYRENYDASVSRAVAPLNVLLEYMMPFVKIGGYCICMKGSEIEGEIKDAKNALVKLGGEITKIDCFNLSENTNKRNIIVIKKIRKTHNQYPRKAGMSRKSPL